MKVDLLNDRFKSFEEARNKLLGEAEGFIGSMKEYLMKIIEVLLDKSEEDRKPTKDTQMNPNTP
jgi:hypothetical protein